MQNGVDSALVIATEIPRIRVGSVRMRRIPLMKASPAAHLAEALELVGGCYGLRSPEPDDAAGVVRTVERLARSVSHCSISHAPRR
jgi:hypothetical protein